MNLPSSPLSSWRIDGTHLVSDITDPSPTPHAVIRDENERWIALVEITDEEGEANARRIAALPKLLAALTGLLAQVNGPAMIYGDGIGNDGKKTGLSHWEFNALRDQRIAAARAAIAEAQGGD